MRKLPALLFAFAFLTGPVCAQTWDWAGSFGGLGADYNNKVDVDGVDGVYMVGIYEASAAFPAGTLNGIAGTDGFLAKYDTAGTNLWVLGFSSPGNITATGISCDRSGNTYIAGSFSDSLFIGNDTLLPSAGSPDAFIAKFTTDGAYVWSQSAGGTGTSVGWAIDVDELYLYATGVYTGTVDFSGQSVSGGASGIFLTKYDTSGAIVWVNGYGSSSGNNAGYGVVSDTLNVYVTGTFGNTVSFGSSNVTSLSGTNPDAFFVKMDSAGNDVWAVRGGGASWWDGGYDIAVDAGGNVYSIGYFYGSASFGTISLASSSGGTDYDGFACMLDPLGNFVWSIKMGGTGSGGDFAYGIHPDGMGNCYVTGIYELSMTLGSFNVIATGGYDVYVAELDDTGIAKWLESGGGLLDDKSYDLALGGYGDIYISGDTEGASAMFGSHSVSSAGSDDGLIARIQIPMIAINLNATGVSCADTCDGTATVTPTGGFPPYQVLWVNGDTTLATDSLCAGWYSVVVTDSYGFSVMDSVEVMGVALIGVSFSVTNEVVPPGTNGAIDATVVGGTPVYVFDWSNDGTGDFDDSEDLSGLTAGWYVITVMDGNGCIYVDSAEVMYNVGIAPTETESSINVYPNPVNEILVVELASDAKGILHLVDVYGRVVREIQANATLTIDMLGLRRGVYVLRWLGGGEAVRVIKQ